MGYQAEVVDPDPLFAVYHCSKQKHDSFAAAAEWSYVGHMIQDNTPKAKAKVKAKAKAKAQVKAQATPKAMLCGAGSA